MDDDFPTTDAQLEKIPGPEGISAIQEIVEELADEAKRRVGLRKDVEERWIEDLTQLAGEYEFDMRADLVAQKKSVVFINQSRPKANAIAARLGDMLFPTDERNWGIQPTPVPQLIQAATRVGTKVQKAVNRANALTKVGQDAEAAAVAQLGTAMAQAAQAAIVKMDAAKEASENMAQEMDDQLRSCSYSAEARLVIEDAARVGAGVMKGPIIESNVLRRWQMGEGGYQLMTVEDRRPAFRRVDYWGYFPDMTTRSADESESHFERHLLTESKFKKMAREMGFDVKACLRILEADPEDDEPDYLASLRALNGNSQDLSGEFYHVWEYHGPLSREQIEKICEQPQHGKIKELLKEEPLRSIVVSAYFCQGELLRFNIHPLDSDETIYSVFRLEKDEASPFGIGAPRMMRYAQAALNGAWRMMMDNSALSSGPQLIVDEANLEPADGLWEIKAYKLWKRLRSTPKDAPVIETVSIQNNQRELANIIQLAMKFIDDETATPLIAQGEQGAHVTQTAQGMSILMNSFNVVVRRSVKNFDDEMTVPNMRRLYDWNMQFSDKPEMKGDYQVDARGSSVLLVRELQSQSLMVLAERFSVHPIFGPLMKPINVARKMTQSMMVAADEVWKTDAEIEKEKEAAAQQPPPKSPEEVELEGKLRLQAEDNDFRMSALAVERETALIKLAHEHNMELDQLRARLEQTRVQSDSKERIFAAEAALERSTPGNKGSGGYISK